MAKHSFAPPQFTILTYGHGGRRIIGTASLHDLEKTCGQAHSILQLMPEAQCCAYIRIAIRPTPSHSRSRPSTGTLNLPKGPTMKEHEAQRLLQELANDKTFPTKATLDDSHVRPDGSGYCVTIIWQVRKTTVKSRAEWLGIKQAWQSQDRQVSEHDASPGTTHRKRAACPRIRDAAQRD
jgi:hypothetical protein